MPVGGSFYRFWYEKSCLQQAFSRPCAVIATVGYTHRVPMLGEDGVGSTPPSKADPPKRTHLYGVKCTQHADSQTLHGLPHIHPKVGSTVESPRRVRVAGKPSGEPLRKGETQSPTELELSQGKSVRLNHSQIRWVQSNEASNGSVNLPVYLNSDRSDVLFTVYLPFDGSL